MASQGTTRIVLLPGLHGTTDLFDSFLKRCPPGFDPVAVSYPLGRVLTYEALAAEVRGQMSGSTPQVLLGESFSGPVVLCLAAGGLPGLMAVVLVGSFVLPPAPRWMRFFPWRVFFSMRTPFYGARSLLAGSPKFAEVTKRVNGILRTVSADVLAARVRALLTVDARPWLTSCPVPILYLAGTRDLLVRPHCLQTIVACRPDVVIRQLPAPHFILQMAPAEAWNAIDEFMEGKIRWNL